MHEEILGNLRNHLESELKNNILQFWIDYACDLKKGGFYGYIPDDLAVDGNHNKASVLTARILWTFSAAYGFFREEQYLVMAKRAFEYLAKYFVDKKYGGVYWLLDANGKPADTKKQIYAIAFAVYGLSEYYRATSEPSALSLAIALFSRIEEHAADSCYGGYFEALTREWYAITDMRLSPKDMNVAKSMNTHLHILEAYTGLLRVCDSESLRASLKKLLERMLEKIVAPSSWSFRLFFDMDWTCRSDAVSYGHDIEGSWLLYEAAEVLGDPDLLKRIGAISLRMAENVLLNGTDSTFGGIYNERQETGSDANKEWWPQAEAVVGFFNAYELSRDPRYLDASLKTWNFIDRHLIDRTNGEWFREVSRDGAVVLGGEKAGPWKCPYHNGRMCFEMLRRIDREIAGRKQ